MRYTIFRTVTLERRTMTKLTEEELRQKLEQIHRQQMERPTLRPPPQNPPWERSAQEANERAREYASIAALA